MSVQLLQARAIVDAAGNLQVHGRGGVNLSYQRLVAGEAADISGDALFFEIGGAPGSGSGAARVALAAGPSANVRLIVVEPAAIAALPLRTPIPFALRDETADPAIVRWDGFLIVRGYTDAPP